LKSVASATAAPASTRSRAGGIGRPRKSALAGSRTPTTALAASGYTIAGELTLKGVNRQIEIPFDFHGVVSDPWGLRAGFTSQFTVDRRDFGITWDRIFDWGLMAGHDLTFTLDIELVYPDESLAQAPQQVE